MSADMAGDGYPNIISTCLMTSFTEQKPLANPACRPLYDLTAADIDFSQVLIDQMREKHPQLEWHVLDIREMKENAEMLGGAESYDAIIDKGEHALRPQVPEQPD